MRNYYYSGPAGIDLFQSPLSAVRRRTAALDRNGILQQAQP